MPARSAARRLQQGEEPTEPWHPQAYQLRTRRIEAPRGTPVEAVIETLLDLDPEWEAKALRAFELSPDEAARVLPALV